MEAWQNFKTEPKLNLKQANVDFVNCFNDKFLPVWLKGGSVQLSDICGSQLEKMQEQEKEVYGEFELKP